MWRRTVVAAGRNISIQKRLSHQIQAGSNGSYLRNPGSEPLTISTLGQVLEETAHKYPDRVAVRSVHEGLSLTYEQLLNQADTLGCALRAQGLEKGDRVGLWSHNNVAWIVTLVAAARAGLISVLINPVYERAELSFCLRKVGIKSLFIGDKLPPNRDYYRVLQQLIPSLQKSTPGCVESELFPNLTSVITDCKEKLPGTFTFNSLVSGGSKDITRFAQEVAPEDGSIIHFTSGTTGEPKAGLDSHIGVVNNTYFVGKRNGVNEGHHNVCVQVPLFHALGSIITVLTSLRHGASLVLAAPSYNIQANINTLMTENISMITGTPTMFVDMLSQMRSQGASPPGLKMALAAGAPCSPELIRQMQKHLKAESVRGLYGLTESTACIFQSLPGDSIDVVAETVGFLTDHVEVKVVDENDEIVPIGSPGELLSRGYNNMICYWDEPKKTRQAIGEDGWLRTGDKFTISKEGYGKVVGRLKDIIVRGGENIAPKEIEDHLTTHPDIIESQVVGLADERLGEELCAVLRLREGASITLDDVRKHLTGKIAKFKIPRILKITDEYPKTASGKIQKYKLKEIIEAGKL